ncbi:MAG: hypothetical protein ACXAB7_00515 [Candidatus Kariarchaeaceae archaeon]|jgi:hypothetical protein
MMVEENVNLQHGPAPEIEIYNKSLSVISADSTMIEEMSIIGEFGQYTVTAGLMSNGTILPKSVNSMVIQVISQPIGNLSTLLLIILIVVLLMIVLIPIPAIIDKLKTR